MKRLIVGIDPGKQGAIAFLEIVPADSPVVVKVVPLPRTETGSGLDVIALYHLINRMNECPNYTKKILVEAQWHGVGGKIVKELGAIIAICQIVGVDVVEVQPLAWKKVVIPGFIKGKDAQKGAMIQKCADWGIQLPTLTKNGKKLHDGCADAIGIAYYGVQKHG
jgi:hypothetical protein